MALIVAELSEWRMMMDGGGGEQEVMVLVNSKLYSIESSSSTVHFQLGRVFRVPSLIPGHALEVAPVLVTDTVDAQATQSR